jgi:hypothetical protein
MAVEAPKLAPGALHPIRVQHHRPSVSSSQCRPLEPQATHAKFLAATSTPTSGATSRHRPICSPTIGSSYTLLHSATRPPLRRLQCPAPRLVDAACRLLQPALESPPLGLTQHGSFSSKGSRSIPTMTAADMVHRTRTSACSKAIFHFPSPYTCVRPHHSGKDEPFLHRGLVLKAMLFDFA